jgi:DNA-binding NarL/FixJ family response regulator
MQDSIAKSKRVHPTLTPREEQVLSLVAKGKSDKDIAEALQIAKATVQQHLRNIYRKLDVHNRTSALYVAQESRKENYE